MSFSYPEASSDFYVDRTSYDARSQFICGTGDKGSSFRNLLFYLIIFVCLTAEKRNDLNVLVLKGKQKSFQLTVSGSNNFDKSVSSISLASFLSEFKLNVEDAVPSSRDY